MKHQTILLNFYTAHSALVFLSCSNYISINWRGFVNEYIRWTEIEDEKRLSNHHNIHKMFAMTEIFIPLGQHTFKYRRSKIAMCDIAIFAWIISVCLINNRWHVYLLVRIAGESNNLENDFSAFEHMLLFRSRIRNRLGPACSCIFVCVHSQMRSHYNLNASTYKWWIELNCVGFNGQTY